MEGKYKARRAVSVPPGLVLLQYIQGTHILLIISQAVLLTNNQVIFILSDITLAIKGFFLIFFKMWFVILD